MFMSIERYMAAELISIIMINIDYRPSAQRESARKASRERFRKERNFEWPVLRSMRDLRYASSDLLHIIARCCE